MKTLLAFLALLILPMVVAAQTVSIQWELVIGDDESASEEYLLGGPTAAFDDASGNIYVVEASAKEVRVYDAQGIHLYTVGTPGNAPGEFQDISAATIDEKGQLTIIDRFRQRVTIYEPLSKAYQTLPFDPDRYIEPWALFSVNEQFATIGVPTVDGIVTGVPNLVSFYDSSFKAAVGGAANVETIYDLADAFQAGTFRGYRGHNLWVDPSGASIIVVPKIYNGKIHLYRKKQDGGWSHERILASAPDRKGYKQVEMSTEEYAAHLRGNSKARSNKPPVSSRSNPSGLFRYESLRSSLALYALSDGSVVHFSHEWNRRSKTKDLRYELFSSEGEFLATGLMEDVVSYEPGGRPAQLLFFESGGQKANTFYAVDYQSGAPVVRRGTLTVK